LWNAYWTLVGRKESSSKTVLLVNIGARTTNLVIAKGPDELILIRDFQLAGGRLVKGQEKEWAEEISDSLMYARSKGGLRALEAVYLTGGGSSPDILSRLQSAIPAPITLWNPLHQIARNSEYLTIEDSAGPLLAVAIGLSLRRFS